MNIADVFEGTKRRFQLNGLDILLIKTGGDIHVIDNHCGHFGASLDNAKLDEDSITCSHHLAKFSLEDGCVLNDVVEDCDRLKIYEWKVENQIIIACI